VLLIEVSLHVITTIHGFSKGPSWLTSFFLLIVMYILIKSLGLEWHVYFLIDKSILHSRFWKSQWQFFLGESKYYCIVFNLFEKLGKSKIKNWNLHSNISNLKNYQKDKCSIQCGL
jgi:uncharacterized membrane protein SirB2